MGEGGMVRCELIDLLLSLMPKTPGSSFTCAPNLVQGQDKKSLTKYHPFPSIKQLSRFSQISLHTSSSALQTTFKKPIQTALISGRQLKDYVLSHPNGWEGTQQSQMRSAAILAGLIPGHTYWECETVICD